MFINGFHQRTTLQLSDSEHQDQGTLTCLDVRAVNLFTFDFTPPTREKKIMQVALHAGQKCGFPSLAYKTVCVGVAVVSVAVEEQRHSL